METTKEQRLDFECKLLRFQNAEVKSGKMDFETYSRNIQANVRFINQQINRRQ